MQGLFHEVKRLEKETGLVLWMPPRAGSKSPVIGLFRGRAVFPSNVGQAAPNAESVTRLSPARIGFLEKCELYPNPTGSVYIAYPSAIRPVLAKMPGVLEPCLVKWEENLQKPGEMIATVFAENFKDTYFRVFFGDIEKLRNFHWLVEPEDWNPRPKSFEETYCNIGWNSLPNGMYIGYAFPSEHRETIVVNVGIDEIGNVVYVPGNIRSTQYGGYALSASISEDGKVALKAVPR